MIRLTESLSRVRAATLSSSCVNTLWNGRLVQNIPLSQTSSFSGKRESDKDSETLTRYPLPKEPSSGPPDYLKRGSPIEISMRPDFSNCDDPRTEEEREQDAEAFFQRLARKGLLLTAEQAAKIYPDAPYFKKQKGK